MPRQYVSQLANGDGVDELFLVSNKQVRANRQGNLYLHLDLRDKSGVIGARLWNVTDSQTKGFEAGDYLQVRGKVQVFQGALQLILSHIQPARTIGVDPEEFWPSSPHSVTSLMSTLKSKLMGMSNPHLRALVECFLIDEEFVAKFTQAPAGVSHHHAYHAGLLEHVVALLALSSQVTDLYPELDRDLLLTGVFLHDIGKVDELSFDRTFAYTDEGQLVGHLVIGVEMLTAKAKQVTNLIGEPFPDELLLRLKHMILSHHGSHEFGSPKVPMTPEAIALHLLDNLDSKIHTFTREIRDDPASESRWTPFHQGLNRRLFKGQVAILPRGDLPYDD